MKKQRVAVAMSGGVDSCVCALVIKNKGYETVGLTLKLFDDYDGNKKCGTKKEIEDAKKACEFLGIKHFVYDYTKEFKNDIIEKFVESYENGLTPNPCVLCNREIKFNKIIENAEKMGFEYIATGHYANIEYNKENNRYLLKKARCEKKDQSYFLYRLSQKELSHTMFPLGDFESKEEVRNEARKHGVFMSDKSDSQDICFIKDESYIDFIKNYRNKNYKKGNFVDKKGNILGKHQGIINYTVGQRKGLGISFGKPMYVVDKIKETNEVVLGDEEDLYSNSLIVNNINLIYVDKIIGEMNVKAKIRYNFVPKDAVIKQIDNDTIKVDFKESVKSVTKGQACVFYYGDYVVGGGTII